MFKKQCQVKIEKMNFNKKYRKNLKRKTENLKNVLKNNSLGAIKG